MKSKVVRVHLGLFIMIFAVSALSTGCEPLRKKFTRKKKETQETEFVPVLDPVDYPAKQETPEATYKLHYSLWQGWYKDYVIAVQEGSSDKKIRYDLEQLVAHGAEMQKVLQGEKQKQMSGLLAQMEKVQAQYKMPRGVRDDSSLLQQMNFIDKNLRQNLKFQYVKDSLIPTL